MSKLCMRFTPGYIHQGITVDSKLYFLIMGSQIIEHSSFLREYKYQGHACIEYKICEIV